MFESSTCNFMLLAQAAESAAEQAEAVPFYQTGTFMFGCILALLFLSWFVAKTFANSLRMNDYSGRLFVILTSILVATLIVTVKFPPKFGVDLKGGMNLIGSLNMEAFEDLDPGAQAPEAKDLIPNLIKRVDPSGTREIMIRPLGKDKIEVTIPSVSSEEADAIWDRLAKAGHLQFRIVASRQFSQHANAMDLAKEMADKRLPSRLVKQQNPDGTELVLAKWYNLAREDVDGGQMEPGQLLAFKYIPESRNLVRDSRSLGLIDMNQVNFGVNRDNHGKEFAEWCQRNKVTPQILMMEPEDDSTNVEGKHISQVRADVDEYARPCISFNMSDEGGQKLGLMTQLNKPDNQGKRGLGIVLDGQLHTAPTIEEPIYDRGRISGSFTRKEVDDVIINLRSGKLDVALNKNPISKQYIESSLGEELKQKGLFAIGISFVIVLIFMMIYYRFAGFVACGALLINLLLIMALIMAIRQPLSLTGLAGLVLTVGMSVDANVLIFERIREELDRGSALRMAIRNGFDKATTTIVDANVTTLITALVLYVIGTEQIKGFAVTLILGILMSMFTAIYCSRTVFDIAEKKRWLTRLGMMRIMTKSKIDFIGKRGIAAVFSMILIGLGIAGMWALGPKILNHDLRGGSTARVVFEAPQDIEAVRDQLAQETIVVNEEEIEFSVSKIVDPNFEGRVFKVDSNIPTYDGVGEAPYDQLSDVLTRVFEGKLTQLHVNVGKTTSQKRDAPGVGQIKRSGVPPMLTAMSLTNPTLLLQDSGETTEPAQENDTDPSTEGASDTQNDQEGSETATEEPAAGSETTPAQDPAEGSGDFPEQPSTSGLQANQNETVTELEFDQPITGKALKTFLMQAAENLNVTLEEEQITTESPDVGQDESANSVSSTKWTVKLDLPREDEAIQIFDKWSSEFNGKPYFPTTSGVGGQIARETQLQALAAIIASLLGIIAYVWIRFQNVAFGLAAVVALVHDVLIVLGAIALSHFVADGLGFMGIVNFKISLPIVAALLTIIGYSLNDTIVVFDRIREVRGKRSEITADMINTSICQTLSRTILTSLTTFIVVFILYWFGGDAIHGFAFALVVGVIVGTYSSIFVASPTLLWLMNRVGLNPGAAIETE